MLYYKPGYSMAVLLAYFITAISNGLYKGRGDKTMEGFASAGLDLHRLAGVSDRRNLRTLVR
jgi:hypothetical protein